MKYVLSLLLFAIGLLGCDKNNDQMTQLPPTDSPTSTAMATPLQSPSTTKTSIPLPTATNTPAPTVTPSNTPTPTPISTETANRLPSVEDRLHFPSWVSDPSTPLLLFLDSTTEEFATLGLFDAETGRKFTFDVKQTSAFFWAESGEAVELLGSDLESVVSISLRTASLREYKIAIPSNNVLGLPNELPLPLRLASDSAGNQWLQPSNVDSDVISTDGRFLAKRVIDRNYYETIYIYDLLTGESEQLQRQNDDICDLDAAWLPQSSNLLLVRQSTVTDVQMACDYITQGSMFLTLYDAPSNSMKQKLEGRFGIFEIAADGNRLLHSLNDHGLVNVCIEKIDNREEAPTCISANENFQGRDFSRFQWRNEDSIFFLYSETDYGGLCYFDLEDNAINCPTDSVMELEEQFIRNYRVSVDGKYAVLLYDSSCMACEIIGTLRLGVFNLQTNQFVMLGSINHDNDVSYPFPLWRPTSD